MNFLAPGLLAFGLVMLVPLTLHLYHQRKRTVVRFSTNRFFTDAVSQSQRRMQLQRWLLMLLRMLVCLLLAAAVARPYLSARDGSASAGRREVVLLIDDSLSMSAAHGDHSAFESARATAEAILESLHAKDRAALLTVSGRLRRDSAIEPPPTFTHDKRALIDKVRTLTTINAAGDSYAALKSAAALFADTQTRAPLLIILTDRQRGQWPEYRWPQPAAPTPVVMVQTAGPPEDNLWVHDARLSPPVLMPGKSATIEVMLRNSGTHARRAQLIARVNERTIAARTIVLEAYGRRREQITLDTATLDEDAALLTPDGSAAPARIEVFLQAGDDPLPQDNSFYVSGTALARLSVLIIDGQYRRETTARSSFYVASALRSLPDAPVEIEQAALPQAPWSSLADYRVVILLGAAEIPEHAVQKIAAFIRSGGGVIIFTGDGLNRDFYNNGFTDQDSGPLLPATITEQINLLPEADPMRMRRIAWEHEIFRRYEGDLRAALADITVRRAWGSVMRDGWALAELDGGIPFIAERRIGGGGLLMIAAMPEPAWTELPLRRNFVGLIHRCVAYLAVGREPAQAYQTGQDLRFVPPHGSIAPPTHATGPDGEEFYLTAGVGGAEAGMLLPGERVKLPGFYTAQLPGGGPPLVAAVNISRQESTAETADFEVLKERAGEWELNLLDYSETSGQPDVDMTQRLNNILAAGRANLGLWNIMLWLLLIGLAVEPVFANIISGSDPQINEKPPAPETEDRKE